MSCSALVSCRLRVRFLLWPITAAVCFVVNSSCWEGCFHVQTRSRTAAATRCTSSIRTSPSGMSPFWQETNPPLAQGKTAHLSRLVFTDAFRHFIYLLCFSVSHSACVMQERKIYVFGGWDTPVCYNDMYMLDLGKAQTHRCTQYVRCVHDLHQHACVFLRSDGVFCSQNQWRSPLPSKVLAHMHAVRFKSFEWNCGGRKEKLLYTGWCVFPAGTAVLCSQTQSSWSTEGTTETTRSLTPSSSISVRGGSVAQTDHEKERSVNV